MLREVEEARPDALVFAGDVTWGPQPEETYALVAALVGRLGVPSLFVKGNAERALLEAAGALERGSGDRLTARERWLVARHSAEAVAFLADFVESADGLGAVRVCHGSPRSDEELVTFATPETRMRDLLSGIDEHVLVTAHTHIQFDRRIAGVRSVNPGSVGMPYEGPAGVAYWALLGPDVELRRTEYDLGEAVRRYRATDDPVGGADGRHPARAAEPKRGRRRRGDAPVRRVGAHLPEDVSLSLSSAASRGSRAQPGP